MGHGIRELQQRAHLNFRRARQHEQPSSPHKIHVVLVFDEAAEHLGKKRAVAIARHVLKQQQTHCMLLQELRSTGKHLKITRPRCSMLQDGIRLQELLSTGKRLRFQPRPRAPLTMLTEVAAVSDDAGASVRVAWRKRVCPDWLRRLYLRQLVRRQTHGRNPRSLCVGVRREELV